MTLTYEMSEERGGDDENGPKRRETRRLGFRWVFFCFLTYVLLYVQFINYEINNEEGGVDENGPKRRILRRLGPMWVFFNF